MLTFDQAVERIKELDAREDAQRTTIAFEMGDVALERIPIGQQSVATGRYTELAQIADEAGVPFATLRERRYVASRIPAARRRAAIGFEIYREVARTDEDERTRALDQLDGPPPEGHTRWTINAVRTMLGKRLTTEPRPVTEDTAITLLETSSPETKREAIKALIEDPEVLVDQGTRSALQTAIHEGSERRKERVEEALRDDPIDRGLRQATARGTIWTACLRAEKAIQKLVATARKQTTITGRTEGSLEHFEIGRSLEAIKAGVSEVRGLLSGQPDSRGVADRLLGSALGEGHDA